MNDLPIRQAAILVGGKGTRLGDITRDLPKPMLPIGGDYPFLDHLLEMVARHGYSDILLLSGHLGDRIEETYQGRRVVDSTVRVLCERELHGTGGALTIAREHLDDGFLLMNGDSVFDINLRALELEARRNGLLATVALRSVDDVSRYGRVEETGGKIVRFLEKDSTRSGRGTINGGIYVLKREILDFVQTIPCSIEKDVFPRLVERGEIGGKTFDGYFLDIGTPEALERGHNELPSLRIRPAAYLDRDSVINVDDDYVHPETLQFMPGAVDAIRFLNERGFYVFVVTNQSGIACGCYGNDDTHRFDREIQTRLVLAGAHIDRFYTSPYHPDGAIPQFATDHFDRKPNSGIIFRSFAEWRVDRGRSFLVGDKQSDLTAAERAGIEGHLYAGGNLAEMVRTIIG